MSGKNFVVEIQDLDNERREIVVAYGGREIPIAYNPGAVTREAMESEREGQQAGRRQALLEALEGPDLEKFLDVDESGAAYVADSEGAAGALMAAMAEADRANDVLIDALAGNRAAGRVPLLVDWPLVERGEPLEITAETLSQRPYMFVAAVYAAIMEDMTPGKKRSRTQGRPARRRR